MPKNRKKIWMQVSQDKYELPVVVADTARELADMIGTTENNIVSQISHYKHRKVLDDRKRFPCQFVVVEMEEEE